MLSTIKQLKNLKGKRVLVRVDFNVPIKNGKVKDDFKIKKSLSTIEYLIKMKAKIILVSHLGRPDGMEKKELSLAPVKKYLEKILRQKIKFYKLNELNKIKNALIANCEIAMLENIRFSPDEKKDIGTFARDLASIGDIFIIDGFAVAHRPAASVSGIAKYLPTYAGLLLEKELAGLTKVIAKPKKPFIVILGGVKMETKIPVLEKLLPLADHILVGGGIVNTYLSAKGCL